MRFVDIRAAATHSLPSMNRRFPPLTAAGRPFPGVLAALLVALGCQGEQPPSYRNNLMGPQEASLGVPGRADQELSSSERARVLASMRSVAEGQQPVNPPAKAPRGVRWSDIPKAVGAACNVGGVEMAVVRTSTEPDRYGFELKTIESWPAGLVIVRGDGDAVYEIGEVWVGRFPNQPDRKERAQKLVEAFEEKLKELGALRWFNDE